MLGLVSGWVPSLPSSPADRGSLPAATFAAFSPRRSGAALRGGRSGRPSGKMSQKLLAGGLSLARASSVLVFFGPDSQAGLLPFPQKPNRRRTPFSHGTAQAQPARLSAFAPLPSAPSLRPPSPLRGRKATPLRSATPPPTRSGCRGVPCRGTRSSGVWRTGGWRCAGARPSRRSPASP